MKQLLELGKTLLIIVLLCTLVLLAVASVPVETIRDNPRLSRYLQPLAPLLGLPEAELAYVETALPALDAAQPVLISVSNSMGRSTAVWDFSALDAQFETYGGLLGQALDTADLFTGTSDAQFRKALSGDSVFFRYGAKLPVALLASWLGAEQPAAVPQTDALLLSIEGDAVVLYLVGEPHYRALTQMDPAALEPLLAQVRPDGSKFAFEADSPLSALTLLPGGSVSVSGVAVSNPCDNRYIDQLATDLGFNPYGETRYTDDEGTTYFSETNATLQISAAGDIRLTGSPGNRFGSSSAEDNALVEQARRLVETAMGDLSSDGRIYLSGLYRQNNSTVCTFDYWVSGIPVSGKTNAARVVFTGQAFSSMDLQAMTFRTTGETIHPLPVAQAAAIVPENSTLTLQYRLSNSTLTAGWKD